MNSHPALDALIVDRAAEKQASRDSDLARLASGAIDREGLQRENSFFSPLKLSGLRIAAIGGRRIATVR